MPNLGRRASDKQSRQITDGLTKPFAGGQNKYNEPALLPYGTYSSLVNMRQMHPGMKQRPGYIKKHSTANGVLKALTLFQYSKGKRTERHFYCQWSDSTVQEATHAPPAVTTGDFGSTVFTGTASPLRASYSVINDKLLFSNGVDQHQICAGTDDYIDKFITYSSATALPAVPTIGADYTEQVTDISTATFAVLSALGTNATDCVGICSQIQANRAYFGMTANVNANAVVTTVSYWNGSWQAVSGFTDGTIGVTGKTLSQSGYMTWTQPTDAIPKYMYNQYGFWLKLTFSAALSGTVQSHTCNFGSAFTAMQNLWDGVLNDAIEAQLTHTNVYTMGTMSITVGGMTSADTLIFSTSDAAEMLYIDVGNTPNTNTSTMSVFYLATDGTWTSISSITDGTVGVAGKTLSQSGFVVLGRQTTQRSQQYNYLPYNAYWYKITVNATLSGSALSDLSIGIQFVPYFSISDFGIGITNAAWKNRGVFTFDKNPEYIVMSANGNPQLLSSSDSAIYKVGDGRANKILAMKPFYNELICAQEERGNDGGCITLVQGTTPANLGKVILSNYYGVMNSQCLCVIDGFTFGQKEPGIVAFILSKRGICYTDGRGVQLVPGFWMVKNYFDPSNSTCIRAGYESEMFIKYDSSYNVLIIGLVTGASATVCNTWLVYDLREMAFSTDTYANAMASVCEADAASGNVPIIQLAGGTADGFVYILNSGLNDISTPVDSYVTLELNAQGMKVRGKEMIVRAKVQAAGTMTVTPYLNGVAQTAYTLPLTAENTNDTIRRNKLQSPTNLVTSNPSLKLEHNTASESFYLLDWGLEIEDYSKQ